MSYASFPESLFVQSVVVAFAAYCCTLSVSLLYRYSSIKNLLPFELSETSYLKGPGSREHSGLRCEIQLQALSLNVEGP